MAICTYTVLIIKAYWCKPIAEHLLRSRNISEHTIRHSDPNEAQMQIRVALLEHSGMADVNYIISYVWFSYKIV